jgi:hypothetical protein
MRNAPKIAILLITAAFGAFGQSTNCPRFATGSTVVQPEDLYSKNGVLEVGFVY